MSPAMTLLSMLPPESRDILVGYLPVSLREQIRTIAFEPTKSLKSKASQRLLRDFHRDLVRHRVESPPDLGILHLEPVEFYDLLKDEIPETISAILLCVRRKQASEYLCMFPLRQRIAIVRATLCRNRADDTILEELADELRRHDVPAQNENSSDRNDGAEFLREVVCQCEPSLAAKLLSTIERADVQFAQEMQIKDAG